MVESQVEHPLRLLGFLFNSQPNQFCCFVVINCCLILCKPSTSTHCVSGPTFQIEAQPNKRCLAVQEAPGVTEAPHLALTTCSADDPAQIWSWVSSSQLKNNQTQQCIQTNFTSTNSYVITTDCDVAIAEQKWTYDKLTTSLSDSSRYLDSETARITYVVSRSHWMAKVKEGVRDLTSMQGKACNHCWLTAEAGSGEAYLRSQDFFHKRKISSLKI